MNDVLTRDVAHERDGSLALTYIDGLRAVANDPAAKLAADVAIFFGKKGCISARAGGAGLDITEKGRESLADIDFSAA